MRVHQLHVARDTLGKYLHRLYIFQTPSPRQNPLNTPGEQTGERSVLHCRLINRGSEMRDGPLNGSLVDELMLILPFPLWDVWLLVSVVNMIQHRATWEESLGIVCLDQDSPWACLWGIFLITFIDMGGLCLEMDSTIPWFGVLNYLS